MFICIIKFLKTLGLFLLDPVHLCSPIGVYGNICGITIPWIPTVFPGCGKSKLISSFHILHSLKPGLLPFQLRPCGRGPTRDSLSCTTSALQPALLSPHSIYFSELVQPELWFKGISSKKLQRPKTASVPGVLGSLLQKIEQMFIFLSDKARRILTNNLLE